MMLQQRVEINISYAVSFFSDLLKRVKHDRYLNDFAGYRLFLIKHGSQTPAFLHVDYMAVFCQTVDQGCGKLIVFQK